MRKIILLLVAVVGIMTIVFSRYVAASSGAIDIVFDADMFGKVTQSIGIKGSGTTEQSAQEIISTFGQTPLYIKLVNPSTGSIAAPQFQTLSTAGYKWYFLFTQNTSVTAVLDTYKTSYQLSNLVVELETVDAGFIQTLKTNYPGIRVHAGHLPVWPRSQVNEIYSVLQPSTIEGVSFWIGTINRGNVFDDIKLTFDTFFDASKSIAGETVNHPANAILSVSDTQYPPYTAHSQKTAYMSGLISSTIITSVQSQDKGGQAPIRYIVPGSFAEFSAAEKVLLSHYARFMAQQPDIVWPEAIGQNGDPWDNPFLANGDTRPIVGVIGKIPNGFYGFLTNTSEQETFVNLGNRIDFASHVAVSVLHGTNVIPTNGTFGIAAHDTIVIYPNNLPNSTPTSGITMAPGQHTPTTSTGQLTITSAPAVSCDMQKKQGNFNCTGVVDQTDFTAWKESYTAKTSTLSFFEYWRRTFHP